MGFIDRINRATSAAVNRFGEFTAVAGAETAPVIYDSPFLMAEQYEGQVETSAPACSMLDADAARLGVKHGTLLSIRTQEALVGNFEVIGSEPDGLGLTRFLLTKVRT